MDSTLEFSQLFSCLFSVYIIQNQNVFIHQVHGHSGAILFGVVSHMVQHSALIKYYNTILYIMILCNAIQCSTIKYYTVPYCTMQSNAEQHNMIVHNAA